MSRMGEEFDVAGDYFKEFLGDVCTYRHVDSATSYTITLVFNEFVGQIDDLARSIFTGKTEDFTSDPRRGDEITLNGEVWTVIDVRKDEAGMIELRADRSLEDA